MNNYSFKEMGSLQGLMLGSEESPKLMASEWGLPEAYGLRVGRPRGLLLGSGESSRLNAMEWGVPEAYG